MPLPPDLTRVLSRAQRPYMAELFGQQRAFLDDESRSKAALCSRRAGKTWSACAYLLREAFRVPGSTSCYIALTRASAKRLLWEELIRSNHRHNLNVTFNHSELTAKLDNGSQIFLVGADDAATIERLRGGKYLLAVIDEAASFGPNVLGTLVREILRPALVDLKGTLCMIGTPGAACVGPFFDATTDPKSPYSLHHWTVLDNPHIPHIAEEIENEKLANHWDDTHPIYRREWLGEWVRDSGSLVYQFTAGKNLAASGAGDDVGGSVSWRCVLGIDYGFTDATAFCVIGWQEHSKEAVVLESFKEVGLIPSAAAEKVHELNEQYHFRRIVGDVGGMGKGYAEEARQRFAIPIQPAQKLNKRGYIDLINGDLISGLLKVVGPRNRALIEEMSVLQWAPKPKDSPAGSIWHEEEDSRFDNHLCDAMLYAWRECKAFRARPAPVVLPPIEAAEKAMEQQIRDQLKQKRLAPWDRRRIGGR